MNNCLFCRICNEEIPAKFVYRNDEVVVFSDIKPQAPVHLLVVPRRHISSLTDPAATDPQILVAVNRAVQEVAKEYHLGKGFRVVVNCGEEGGQTVPHLHYHVLGGRPMGWPPG